MKILWLSHLVPYPPKAGVLQRAYSLIRETSKRHEVHLLAFNQPNLMKPIFSDASLGLIEAETNLSSFCKTVKFFEIDSDTKVLGKYRLALKSLISTDPYSINWLKSRQYEDAIIELTSQIDIDLVFYDTISLAIYRDRLDHIPGILDHHNIESHLLLRRSETERSYGKRYYFRQEGERLSRFESEVCNQFAMNITCSELDAARLTGTCSNAKIAVVPNAVNTDCFSLEALTDRNPKSLLFLGTLDWDPNRKAVEVFCAEIWPELKRHIPDVTFDLVGSRPPDCAVELAKTDPCFRVHGFVDNIAPFYQECGTFVCPIYDGGGTKLKLLEAMAAGCCVVANPIACEGIEVKSGHHVIHATSAREYVDAIKLLGRDSLLRSTLRYNARKLMDQYYSYAYVGRMLDSILLSVVD